MGGIFNNRYDPGSEPYKPLVPVEFSGKKDNAIILPTVLRVSAEEINYWTNMTCLYDKQWVFNPKLSTVPLCFFHIISMRFLILSLPLSLSSFYIIFCLIFFTISSPSPLLLFMPQKFL